MNNFIIAGLLFLFYVICKIMTQKYRYLSPSLIGSFFWSLACFISSIRMNDSQEEFSFQQIITYIIPFAIVTILGFIIADVIVSRSGKFVLSINQLLYIQKKYKFILILCFIFGSIRFVYTLSLGGISSIVNYREVSLLLSTNSNPIFVNFIRISGHLSMLGTFYIIICAYIDGLTEIKPIYFLKNFVMYGMIVASQGGRTFTMVYLVSYIFAYICGFIQSGKRDMMHQLKKVFVCMLIPLLYFGVVGSLRNFSTESLQSDNRSRSQSVFETFYYITEGLHVSDLCMSYLGTGQNRFDYGRDTFTTSEGYNYSQFRASLNGTKDWCNVDSILVPLCCDFGKKGALVMWMIICFLGELFFNFTFRKRSLISLFLLYSIAYIFIYSTIGNPIPGGFRIMLLWIIILKIFSKRFFPQIKI